MRWTVAVLLALGCGGKDEAPPAPEPEPTTPAPAPTVPEPTGPPSLTDNADSYDFGLGDTAAIYAEAAGVYAVTCVGETAEGFLGEAYLEVGPGTAMALLRADGSVFLATVPDGTGDFAQRNTDALGAAEWTLNARGEGPTDLQTYEFVFGDDGAISAIATDPLSGSVHCVDYNESVTLDSGAAPPALLTGLAGPAVRLTGPGAEVDVTVDADGTVTIDRAPEFDGVADFVFAWTGGADLVVVDLSAGDWAYTAASGEWTIVIQAEGGSGNGGITLTGDATGLTGATTDLLAVGS